MGASKRLAEMVLQLMAQNSGTRFSMVRFGNVLGSSGSVVPLFRKQIAAGGPVTVTHTEITRYFMTIPEAAQLVIQAGSMASNGDVFVLDMGEPVKIISLARRMIELSGLRVKTCPEEDGIEIKVTGLRRAEKLYEELLIGSDPQSTKHKRILRSKEPIPDENLFKSLKDIENVLHSLNEIQIKNFIANYIPEIL
jgi:FlaA1/EpsC-like NDP-sugar epimerase